MLIKTLCILISYQIVHNAGSQQVNIQCGKWNIIIISMSSKKRFNVQKEVMDHISLKQMIREWFKEHGKEIDDQFLVSVKRMKELQAQFQQKCIQYTILRRLPWIVSDKTQESIINVNTDLKRNYQKLIITTFFNTENTFELFIFYLVKVISLFMKQCFRNLLVDMALQAQLCIVLYYTFLGIEIKEKAYEIIKRKYSKSLSKNTKSYADDRSLKTSKGTLHQSLMRATSNKKLQKNRHSIHFSRESICKPLKQSYFKDNVADISDILKQNLHVNPLPPLKERKVKLRELQRLKTQPTAQEMDYSPNIKVQYESKQPSLHKKSFVYSNQLSNSLKALHPQQLLFQLNSKQVKINQSFHDFRTTVDPINFFQKRKDQLKQSFHKKQPELKSELKSSGEWLDIIGNLKKKVFDLRQKTVKNEPKKQKNEDTLQADEQQITTAKESNEASLSSNTLQVATSSQLPSLNIQEISFSKMKIQERSDFFKVSNYPQQQPSAPELFRTDSKIFRQKKKARNSIRNDQDTFASACKARLSSILGEEKENQNLHSQWRRHRYRQ